MTAKITLSILTAFVVSFSILSLSLFIYHYKLQDGNWVLNGNDLFTKQRIFFSQKFPLNQEKIFLVGSSQIQSLNPIFIHDDLLKNKLPYTVYNLGTVLDTPKSRLKTIDDIIHAKPQIVVYGISDRDFIIPGLSPSNEFQVNFLPNPHDLIDYLLGTQIEKYQDNFFFLQSPKLDLETVIFGSNYTKILFKNDFTPNPQTWASTANSNGDWLHTITNDTTLKNLAQSVGGLSSPILPLEKNENLIAFKEIIGKLRDNQITVIIFITPAEKYRLEKIHNLEPFNLVLRNISQQYPDVPIYSLWDKYADLNIWHDNFHIARNTNTTTSIYSDDIAYMINAELRSKNKDPYLLSYWTFDDNIQMTKDFGILGKDLIPVKQGGIVPGYIDNAINFTGTNYLKASSPSLYNFTSSTPFSVAFWVKMPAKPIEEEFIDKAVTSHGPGWNIWSYSEGKILFNIGNGKKYSEVSSTISLSDNSWQYIVCTYDGSKNSYGMKIYVNGTLNNRGYQVIDYSISNNQSLAVGAFSNGAHRLQAGTILDDLSIYNIELSGQQINDLFYYSSNSKSNVSHVG